VRSSIEQYALDLAIAAAARSEDPWHRVGACLLRSDKTVASLGYNGPPSGVDIDWSDRDARRAWMVHAEANALRYVRPGEVWLLATTMLPCSNCMLLIASYGIKEVVYRDMLDPDVYNVRDTLDVAAMSGIVVTKL